VQNKDSCYQIHGTMTSYCFCCQRPEVLIAFVVNPDKQRNTHVIDLCTFAVCCLPHLISTEAPPSILAIILITKIPCLAKAFEITFSQLFPTNYGRYDFQETEVAQRPAVIVWPPGNHGIFFPCFVAVNAHNRQFIHFYYSRNWLVLVLGRSLLALQ
jgi:hypothetical protein